ncbi:hypothetical protein A5886_001000 [Enterococcus sp. 8G7_MSG3316]|uniref:Uncharacterized protein n=1 Tax=Candidatus Enterococcus testudinis TaxID=1834191 RepID=A0A242A4H5_9ENTE|nr:hypothetical protein [Enterococcus sp. 8G7_MSG3316]OTN75924.1 hypothetical protein A5886_001000 [Enterococcus sp. 8G7_MSG3316]
MVSSLDTTGTGAVIYSGGKATFTVGAKATFDIQTDGTKAKNIIHFTGISTFKFNDAKNINIQFNLTPIAGSALIYMPRNSYFEIDVQKVNARTTGSDIASEPSYTWTPMFDLKIPYVGSAVTSSSIQGMSMYEETLNEFIAKFDTVTKQGFKDYNLNILMR